MGKQTGNHTVGSQAQMDNGTAVKSPPWAPWTLKLESYTSHARVTYRREGGKVVLQIVRAIELIWSPCGNTYIHISQAVKPWDK